MITLTITPQKGHTYLSMYELLVDTSHAGYVKAWNLGISGNIKANLTKVHIFQTLVKFAFKCFINIAIRSC